MKKIAIAILALLVAGALWAQETVQTQALVQTMSAELVRLGWSGENVAAFEQACQEYSWGTDVDPQALALALRYANRNGAADGQLDARQQARLMNAVANELQTMSRLGLGERETAVAAMNATRLALRTMTGAEITAADGPQRIQARLQDATGDQVQLLERTRIRENEPSGSAARYGEDSIPGAAPSAPPSADAPRGPRD